MGLSRWQRCPDHPVVEPIPTPFLRRERGLATKCRRGGSGEGVVIVRPEVGSATPLRPPREADKNEEAETGKRPDSSAVADRYFPATWAWASVCSVGGRRLDHLTSATCEANWTGDEGQFSSPLCHVGTIC